MSPLALARIQFGMTIGFHFVFPTLTIGMAWFVTYFEFRGWRERNFDYARLGMFFGRLLALTFAVGVATGIVMEFQFGSNWSEYSKYVGDIFGAPLAIEAIFSFFLESIFLGLYLFGREWVSKRVHWLSSLMVAIGATVSAFWILVANSWQQTPAGFSLRNGRAELDSFWAAVLNPSTLPRFFHTVDATLISGAFLVAGISAYWLIRKKEVELAKISLRAAILFGLLTAILELIPFGDWHVRQVAATQPEKFAAFEGIYRTDAHVPMVVFGIPVRMPQPSFVCSVRIPGLLSLLVHGDSSAVIKGTDQFKQDEIPPLSETFISFHLMVALGLVFIVTMAMAALKLRRRRLYQDRRFLKFLLMMTPLPVVAAQLGWFSAEVGRQPWIVYKLLKTQDGISTTVSSGEILFSLITFSCVYFALGTLYCYLLLQKVRKGIQPVR